MEKLLAIIAAASPQVQAGLAIVQLAAGFIQQLQATNSTELTEDMQRQLDAALDRRNQANAGFEAFINSPG